MIIIQEYDQDWAASFAALSKTIREATWEGILIEHVGSTSVFGLSAKPIIDMDVIVSRSEVDITIQLLGKIGYEHRGNLGIEDREAFFAPQHIDIDIDHHLYLCVEGSLAVRNHLILRDHLRSHPEKAVFYGNLKRKLAHEFPNDMGSYVAGKTSFITEVLALCGMTDTELSSIESVNKP